MHPLMGAGRDHVLEEARIDSQTRDVEAQAGSLYVHMCGCVTLNNASGFLWCHPIYCMLL